MPPNADDLFPPSPRVIYEKAPLVQVICQLRFPSLLSIEGSLPATFQERIRGQFPLSERGTNPLLAQLPSDVMQSIGVQVSTVVYQFLTEDRISTVTLTPESLALSTTKYVRWERFRDQLRGPLAALVDIYKPSFFSRVGLRYTDAIDRAQLGLTDVPWSRLLQPHILGELALPQIEANMENVVNRGIRIKIPDGSGSIHLRHGLGNVQGRNDICYMIDLDFFSEQKTEVANAEPTLDHFNKMAGRAFRWCITDVLRDALRPAALADAAA